MCNLIANFQFGYTYWYVKETAPQNRKNQDIDRGQYSTIMTIDKCLYHYIQKPIFPDCLC